MFYRPFSFFWGNFEIKLLVLYCSECHFKNRLALSLPKFFIQPLLKIHFQTFMKIHHSQWFIDIGYVNLATKNSGALGRKNKVRYLYFLSGAQLDVKLCAIKELRRGVWGLPKALIGSRAEALVFQPWQGDQGGKASPEGQRFQQLERAIPVVKGIRYSRDCQLIFS